MSTAGRKLNFDRPHVVYRVYDEHGSLLYVGMTCDLPMRVYRHRLRGLWFDQAAVWHIDGYPTRQLAWAVEQKAIETEAPIYNVSYSEIAHRGWARRYAKASA